MLLAAGACFACCPLMPAARAGAVNAREFARCATLTVDAERLACYDRLARAVPTAGPAPAAPAPEHEDRSFGMVKPPASRPAEPVRLEAKVTGMTAAARGGAVVQLDNDQAWSLDDGPAVLRVGDAVVIKRAALGSFRMTTPTGRVYQVRRLR